jgi:hypothetical protein
MKTKTINAIIAKKMNDWLSSIKDESLQTLLRKNIIVTGGCITSMFLNEEVNDFDIYLKDKQTCKAVAQYYCDQFNAENKTVNKLGTVIQAWVCDGVDVDLWKNDKKTLSSFALGYPDISYSEIKDWCGVETDETKQGYKQISGMVQYTPIDRIKVIINSDGIAESSDSAADSSEYDINAYLDALSDGDEIQLADEATVSKYRPIFLSTNAITLSNRIQIITRFYGTPEEIHTNYDFIHVTNYWTFDTGVVTNTRALEAILSKELFYCGSKYPIASIIRTRKFIKRGWQINAGQYVKMVWQISELNLNDMTVLEDQLTGVDSIYFLNFIDQMKEKQMADPYFKLTGDYLISVIDRIFG